jgi:hypothetical protein
VTLGNEAACCQIEDQAAIHFRIEGEVEVVQGLVWIAEAGLLAPAFQQSIAAACEFVRDQTRDQIDGRHGFGLGLAQACFQHGRDAAEPELAQSALQFRDVHGLRSSVLSWIRSR